MANNKEDKRIQGGEKTLKEIKRVARKMFSEPGYADTFTAEIARKAGVTRGALYHHFPKKKDLFIAVFNETINDLANRVEFDYPEPLKKEDFSAATLSFLKASLDPEIQRIVFIDGPAILGVNVWRQYDHEKLTKPLEEFLEKLIDQKVIKAIQVEAIAHILAGATNEAVRWISNSKNPQKTLLNTMSSFELLYTSIWL